MENHQSKWKKAHMIPIIVSSYNTSDRGDAPWTKLKFSQNGFLFLNLFYFGSFFWRFFYPTAGQVSLYIFSDFFAVWYWWKKSANALYFNRPRDWNIQLHVIFSIMVKTVFVYMFGCIRMIPFVRYYLFCSLLHLASSSSVSIIHFWVYLVFAFAIYV